MLLILCCLLAFSPLASALSGEELVIEAEKYLGCPYSWSGSSPKGFDCGGFTWYVYAQMGRDFGLRIESSELAQQGLVIADPADLQLGDIVFCGYSPNSIGHWAIYSGFGHIIHSYNSGTGVVETLLAEVSPPFCYGLRLPDISEYPAPEPLSGQPSLWAAAEVDMALSAELIPSSLQGGYQQQISRGEFCQLLMLLSHAVYGQNPRELAAARSLTIDPTVFNDTRDVNILSAQALGLVSGYGDGSFRPQEPISREEAALLLMRMLELDGAEPPQGYGEIYAGLDSMAAWAQSCVGFCYGVAEPLSGIPLLSETKDKLFDPGEAFTREQAYISVMRLYNIMITEKQVIGDSE